MNGDRMAGRQSALKGNHLLTFREKCGRYEVLEAAVSVRGCRRAAASARKSI